MHKDDLRVLAKSKNGYITQCRSCNHFQLAFGTSLLTLNGEQMEEFILTTDYELEMNNYTEMPNSKCILLPTFSQSSNMVVTYNEIKQLADLTQTAQLLLDVDQLLSA